MRKYWPYWRSITRVVRVLPAGPHHLELRKRKANRNEQNFASLVPSEATSVLPAQRRVVGPQVVFALLLFGVLRTLFSAVSVAPAADLKSDFVNPPPAARPWVYWFWLNGNITKEGITADLEAMQRVGIGGVLIMEVDQGAPQGPVAFAGPKWRELFKFMLSEANRLGLEVNMTNDAGWCGSGGPWITPELSMQYVVWTETAVEGGRHFDALLPQPPGTTLNYTVSAEGKWVPVSAVAGAKATSYYRDITVLAFPTPAGNARIANINAKDLHDRGDQPAAPANYAEVPADQVVQGDRIVDLTKHFRNGRLSWDAPPGKWTVLRIGHTSTGKDNHPAPETGRGLECDKLSKEAVDAMYAGLMKKIIADSPAALARRSSPRTSTVGRVHSQNWTPRLREEFRRRRGYDLLPLLPRLHRPRRRRRGNLRAVPLGPAADDRRAVGGELRRPLSRAGQQGRHQALHRGLRRRPAGRHDLRRPLRRADGRVLVVGLRRARRAVTEMTSAGHVYGKRIIGAESFTATDGEKWLGHPAHIKTLGDWAFCEGINRFVFHRYAMQPWLERAAGHVDGPLGPALRADRDVVGAVRGLAPIPGPLPAPAAARAVRGRHLLFAGRGCAAAVPAAGGPQGNPPDRPAYNFDGCSADVVLTRMSVKDGRIVLPDGMSYRVLALPDSQTMTPRLLAEDRGTGRGRRDGRRSAAREVAGPGELSGLRRGSEEAGRASFGATATAKR